MFLASDGKCAECGKLLEPSWHGHHIVPFSEGGPTSVENGRALCPDCHRKEHLKKGNEMTDLKWTKTLRTWQDQALADIQHAQSRGAQSFLVNAFPATGKTILALRVAFEFLQSGGQKVFIYCPTRYLAEQWRIAAADFGIYLKKDWINGEVLPPSFHGAAVTYQQVAMKPDFHKWYHDKYHTMSFWDEPHHLAIIKAWGKALEFVCQNDVFRLLETGTPWRTDDYRIPFVHYHHVNGPLSQFECIPDFTYSYAEALRDGVCRPIIFRTIGGDASWLIDDRQEYSTFKDANNSRDQQNLWRAARDPKRGNWFADGFAPSYSELLTLRSIGNDPDAAELVIATSIQDCKAYARIQQKIMGQVPKVVTSDDDDPRGIINDFRHADDPCINAVNMISEGVDIRRLRVLFYVSAVRTTLRINQSIGRVLRPETDPQNPKLQYAFAWFPELEPFITIAQNMGEIVTHFINEQKLPPPPEPKKIREPQDDKIFVAIDSSAEMSAAYVDRQKIEPPRLYDAQKVQAKLSAAGFKDYIPDAVIAVIREDLPDQSQENESSIMRGPQSITDPNDLFEIAKARREAYIKQVIDQFFHSGEPKFRHAAGAIAINTYFKQKYGGLSVNELDHTELNRQCDEMREWMATELPYKIALSYDEIYRRKAQE